MHRRGVTTSAQARAEAVTTPTLDALADDGEGCKRVSHICRIPNTRIIHPRPWIRTLRELRLVQPNIPLPFHHPRHSAQTSHRLQNLCAIAIVAADWAVGGTRQF